MSRSNTIFEKIKTLKSHSGTHSPSVESMLREIPELRIEIDACFLSNPYATELFLNYLTNELVETGKLRSVLEFYPPQAREVARAVSKVIDQDPSTVFVSNGATEAIQAVMHNYVGTKLCLMLPTFSCYYEFVRPDTEVVFYRLKKDENFKVDLDDYLRFVHDQKVDSVVIINPNNPDGGYLTRSSLAMILDELKGLKTVLLDESFIHFACEDQSITRIGLHDVTLKYSNVIIIKSMSKDFGIAGLRAGYAIMKSEMANALFKNGYLWNVSGLANYFFEVYSREEFQVQYELVRKRYVRECQKSLNSWNKIPSVKVYPSQANFALVELPATLAAFDFTMSMLVEHGIYIRDCSDKLGLDGNFVRIAFRSESENEQIGSALCSTLR